MGGGSLRRMRTYRGQRVRRSKLAVFGIILLVLIVLAGATFLILGNYVIYGPDGAYFPWSIRSSPPPSPSFTPVIDIVEPSPSPSPSPSPTPTPTPVGAQSLRAAVLPASALGDQTAVDNVIRLYEAGVISAVVIEVKTEDGMLSYPSTLPAVMQAGLSASGDAALNVIRALKEKDIPLVAQMACFKDRGLPQKDGQVGVKHVSGVNWLDSARGRWLDPYKEPAVQYLLDIMAEVSGLGFDELLLTEVCFPTGTGSDRIDYGELGATTTRLQAINKFLDRVEALCDRQGVALSVTVSAKAAQEGSFPDAGQSVSAMLTRADRVFAPVALENAGESFAAFRTSAGPAATATRFGPVFTLPQTLTKEALQVALDAAAGLDGSFLLTNPQARYPQ